MLTQTPSALRTYGDPARTSPSSAPMRAARRRGVRLGGPGREEGWSC